MDNTSKQTDNIANKSMSFPEHTYYFTYITLFITGILLWVSSVKDAFSIWPFFASTILYSFILCWDIYYKYEWFDLSWYMSFIILALIIGCIFNTVSSALVGYTMETLRGTFAKSKQKIVFDAKNTETITSFQIFWIITTILIIFVSKYLYISLKTIETSINYILFKITTMKVTLSALVSFILFWLIVILGITIYDIIYTKYPEITELNEFRKYYNIFVLVLLSLFIGIMGIDFLKWIIPYISKTQKLDLSWFTRWKVQSIFKILRIISIIVSIVMSGFLIDTFVKIPDAKLTYSPNHFYEIFISFIAFSLVFVFICALYYIFDMTTGTIMYILEWVLPLSIVLLSGYQLYLAREFYYIINALPAR